MVAAQGLNVDRRICCPAAKGVLTVGARAEVCRITIGADLGSGLEGVPALGEAESLTEVEEIAVCLHHRSGGGVEGLKQAVAEFQSRIGKVLGGKSRRGTREANRGIQCVVRADGTGVLGQSVALTVDVLHSECRIDRSLIGVCRWACKVVVVEANEQLRLVASLLVQADSETGWRW